MMRSGIYVGKLRHRRFTPASHEFTYPLFMVCLDIDKLAELMRISPFLSLNRPNIAAFRDRDHFGDWKRPLRERIALDAEQSGVQLSAGRIFLLTHLCYFGYNFNPVSFFFCEREDGSLGAVLAEVNNTFGETCNYWLRPEADAEPSRIKQRFKKRFHVSPFMSLNQEYEWTVNAPQDRLAIDCLSYENDAVIFQSSLRGERREWNRGELHSALLRYPLMTAKVIAAIHWQALRLFAKKVPVVTHPGAGKFQRANLQHLGASWRPE